MPSTKLNWDTLTDATGKEATYNIVLDHISQIAVFYEEKFGILDYLDFRIEIYLQYHHLKTKSQINKLEKTLGIKSEELVESRWEILRFILLICFTNYWNFTLTKIASFPH